MLTTLISLAIALGCVAQAALLYYILIRRKPASAVLEEQQNTVTGNIGNLAARDVVIKKKEQALRTGAPALGTVQGPVQHRQHVIQATAAQGQNERHPASPFESSGQDDPPATGTKQAATCFTYWHLEERRNRLMQKATPDGVAFSFPFAFSYTYCHDHR